MLISVFQTFYDNLLASSWLEAVAVAAGLMSVWYARREDILVYPTGIVNVLIYVYLCYEVKLYADMSINIFYFGMSIYGWIKWTRKTSDNQTRPITVMDRKEWILSAGGLVLFFFALWYILQKYTDSNVPVWDALTTAIFIIGMWLMALKKVENWIFWIAGDLISVPLYASKLLVLSSFQFAVFLALAIAGYIEWRKKFKLKTTSI